MLNPLRARESASWGRPLPSPRRPSSSSLKWGHPWLKPTRKLCWKARTRTISCPTRFQLSKVWRRTTVLTRHWRRSRPTNQSHLRSKLSRPLKSWKAPTPRRTAAYLPRARPIWRPKTRPWSNRWVKTPWRQRLFRSRVPRLLEEHQSLQARRTISRHSQFSCLCQEAAMSSKSRKRSIVCRSL